MDFGCRSGNEEPFIDLRNSEQLLTLLYDIQGCWRQCRTRSIAPRTYWARFSHFGGKHDGAYACFIRRRVHQITFCHEFSTCSLVSIVAI